MSNFQKSSCSGKREKYMQDYEHDMFQLFKNGETACLYYLGQHLGRYICNLFNSKQH